MAFKKKKHKNIKQSEYKTHNKSTSKTLEKSGKVDLEDWALETGELGTKINRVWEFHAFTVRPHRKFARVRETKDFLNNLYWWMIVYMNALIFNELPRATLQLES